MLNYLHIFMSELKSTIIDTSFNGIGNNPLKLIKFTKNETKIQTTNTTKFFKEIFKEFVEYDITLFSNYFDPKNPDFYTKAILELNSIETRCSFLIGMYRHFLLNSLTFNDLKNTLLYYLGYHDNGKYSSKLNEWKVNILSLEKYINFKKFEVDESSFIF
jgi:hypothetical protein